MTKEEKEKLVKILLEIVESIEDGSIDLRYVKKLIKDL